MEIRLIPAHASPREIGILFSEYTDMLIAGDKSFEKYLQIQHYDEELRHLEAKYGPPAGRLYLAYLDTEGRAEEKENGGLAGCIGLRRLDDERCEMKRLYVRPAFRGKGIGGRLIRQVVADAREIGYTYMLLDTLPFLEKALGMYRQFGFYEIPCYNDSPMEASIYMRLDLRGETTGQMPAEGTGA